MTLFPFQAPSNQPKSYPASLTRHLDPPVGPGESRWRGHRNSLSLRHILSGQVLPDSRAWSEDAAPCSGLGKQPPSYSHLSTSRASSSFVGNREPEPSLSESSHSFWSCYAGRGQPSHPASAPPRNPAPDQLPGAIHQPPETHGARPAAQHQSQTV